MTKEPVSNQTKRGFVTAYNELCKANGIEWTKPKYKVIEPVPLIPTKVRVERVIAASSRRYAVIFTLMAETAVEAEELHKTHRNQMSLEERTIRITGRKGHDSNIYKLKAETRDMLCDYLTRNTEDYPFPKAKMMGQMWIRYRNRAANKF